MHIWTNSPPKSSQSLYPGKSVHSLCFCKPKADVQNQGYQRAGLVTTDELALLKKVDRQPKAKIDSILLSDGQSYALLYLRLLNKLQRIDTMQCILVYIADALLGQSSQNVIYLPLFPDNIPDHDERIPLFTRTSETDPDLPYGALLRSTPRYPIAFVS